MCISDRANFDFSAKSIELRIEDNAKFLLTAYVQSKRFRTEIYIRNLVRGTLRLIVLALLDDVLKIDIVNR